MSVNIDRKKLANLIKADLQDFLTTPSRLEKTKGPYFTDYEVISDYIWVGKWKDDDISEEIKELVKENSHLNASRRKEKHEKIMVKEKKRYQEQNIIVPDLPFELDQEEIWPEELEKADYEEIVNLISQVKQVKETNKQNQRKKREEKLASNPHLFYWSGNGHINPRYINEWKKEKYRPFLKKSTEKECRGLNIVSCHPALNNFPFEKAGFYLIEGTDNLPWEACPYNGTPQSSRDNFRKTVELNDEITITPYEINENHDKDIIGNCRKCGMDFEKSEICYTWYEVIDGKEVILEWFCGKCWQTEEKYYRQKSSWEKPVYKQKPQGGNSDIEHCYYFENGRWISLESGTPDPNTNQINGDKSPFTRQEMAKIFEKEWENKKNKDIKEMSISIIAKFFWEHNVKSIEINSSKDLVVKYNNGSSEIISHDERGTGIIKNSLHRVLNKTKLDQSELEKLLTGSNSQEGSPVNSPQSNYIPYLVGGGIVLIILAVVWVSYRLIRKSKKS